MSFLLRWAKRLAWALAIAVTGLWLSLSPGDPALYPARGEGIVVRVLDHGFHSGLIIGQPALRRAALGIGRTDRAAAARLRWLASRFPDADWLEIGWGDAAFYQATPGVEDLQVGLAVRALFVPTGAVLHVVPGRRDADRAFPGSDMIRLELSPKGFAALARRLAATIPEPVPAVEIGPSLYGYGAFYPAEFDYHLFRTCNHWIASLLRAAGVPASPVPGTFSATLMAELRWRSGGIFIPHI